MKTVKFVCSEGCGLSWNVDWKDLEPHEQEMYLKEQEEQGDNFVGVEWDECGEC